LIDVLIGIVDLNMKSVLSLIGNLELQILNVLTIGVAGWTFESEVGLGFCLAT
jgi:NADH:ubiquinone oxidoreductase subunit K